MEVSVTLEQQHAKTFGDMKYRTVFNAFTRNLTQMVYGGTEVTTGL